MGLLRKAVLVGFLLALGALAVGSHAVAAADQAAKRILVFYDENKDDLPGLARTDRGLREAFRAELGKDVEIHSESIGLSRSGQPGFETLATGFYRAKYAAMPPDLIVAVMESPLDFLVREGAALFPGVPVVFSGIDASTIAARKLPPNFTGLLLERRYSPTLELVLRLQPETRNVVVVGGTSRFDRYLQAFVRRDLAPFEGRLNVEYLFDLGMEDLLRRVSSLPSHSAILYVSMLADAAGTRFVPADALATIAAKANAPTFVFIEQYVGLGAVGGNVYSYREEGQNLAALGVRILRGAAPQAIPIRAASARVDMFDARELRRWNLDETRLPSQGIVRFREPSVWTQYRWYILGALLVLLAQCALIAGLLVARARQRRAETEARRQRDDLAHVLRVTTLGELTSSLAHEINQPLSAILLNAQAAMQYLESGRTAAAKEVQREVEAALADIVASAGHASHVVSRVRALFRKEQVRPVAVDVRSLIEDVVRLLHAAMLTERIEMRLSFGAVPPVFGDAVQLEQVVLNVVRNACDAIGAGEANAPRTVTIRTREGRPGYVVIEVSDTGVGVEDGGLERIFAHFVSTKPNGLGMGLAISRSIVDAHGGLIWATANAGRGLTVHIELAAYVSDARGEARDEPRRVPRQAV
jgi:signal transduction histidine kinase